MLDEYTQALEKTFEEHQADAHRRADMQLKAETQKIQKDINKKLSIEQINLKRTLGHKQDELKDKLFVELRDMLANFMETAEYDRLLDAQVADAVKIADGEPMIIYIDPADEKKLHNLAMQHQADVRISEYSFLGGTRAVIPGKNILIDNSFQARACRGKREFPVRFSSTDRRYHPWLRQALSMASTALSSTSKAMSVLRCMKWSMSEKTIWLVR